MLSCGHAVASASSAKPPCMLSRQDLSFSRSLALALSLSRSLTLNLSASHNLAPSLDIARYRCLDLRPIKAFAVHYILKYEVCVYTCEDSSKNAHSLTHASMHAHTHLYIPPAQALQSRQREWKERSGSPCPLQDPRRPGV